MPVMIRPADKAKKIAYKVMGVPANMREKPTRKENEINKRLIYEETARVR